jgi:hypothetical protein
MWRQNGESSNVSVKSGCPDAARREEEENLSPDDNVRIFAIRG